MKKKKQETLAVLAHRARARAEFPRPLTMQDVLAKVGASSQWWNKLARGQIAEPCPRRLAKLIKHLDVPAATFKRALAETIRRAGAGETV